VRIVIVSQGGGDDPSTWSGIPHRLGLAMGELGATVVQVDADPPPPLRRALKAALLARGVRGQSAGHGPEFAALRTRVVARRLRGLGGLPLVQADSGFVAPPGSRYVTYQDMTVADAMRVGWSDPAMMSERAAGAWRVRDRGICRGAVACATASDWAGKSVVSDYGVAAARVHTVGFGINAPARAVERDWTAPRFLFVGREWERKNGPAVVAAFRRVREALPNATLTLVGEHPEVREPGVEDLGALSVGVAADRERLAAVFEQSTCFVLPSLMEPFGIAYLEAGAAGIPSIGTSVGGAATAIGDGGVLVDPGDAERLVEAMRDFADPVTARRLGDRAAAHAAGYTWKQVAARMLGLLAQ
jgi:glycosyltransferase involved in cell wall biosynthesis